MLPELRSAILLFIAMVYADSIDTATIRIDWTFISGVGELLYKAKQLVPSDAVAVIVLH